MEKLSMQELGRISPEAFRAVEKKPFVLVLDNIRSGLNIGSMFRTADAFALTKLVLCGITVQPPHREILKTALGSTDTVDWEWAENTKDAVLALRAEGYKVFAIEQTSQPVWLQEFKVLEGEKYAFVLGNEVDGVGEEALLCCDGAIEIPQFGTKHSLNVAVACGIVVWEAVRGYAGSGK
jgi:23S rRNA (guanosine2251-2'-O)-methyltransferase